MGDTDHVQVQLLACVAADVGYHSLLARFDKVRIDLVLAHLRADTGATNDEQRILDAGVLRTIHQKFGATLLAPVAARQIREARGARRYLGEPVLHPHEQLQLDVALHRIGDQHDSLLLRNDDVDVGRCCLSALFIRLAVVERRGPRRIGLFPLRPRG